MGESGKGVGVIDSMRLLDKFRDGRLHPRELHYPCSRTLQDQRSITDCLRPKSSISIYFIVWIYFLPPQSYKLP